MYYSHSICSYSFFNLLDLLISLKMYLFKKKCQFSLYECQFDNYLCASNTYSFICFKIIFGVSADVLFALGNVFFPVFLPPFKLDLESFISLREEGFYTKTEENKVRYQSKAFELHMPGFQRSKSWWIRSPKP